MEAVLFVLAVAMLVARKAFDGGKKPLVSSVAGGKPAASRSERRKGLVQARTKRKYGPVRRLRLVETREARRNDSLSKSGDRQGRRDNHEINPIVDRRVQQPSKLLALVLNELQAVRADVQRIAKMVTDCEMYEQRGSQCEEVHAEGSDKVSDFMREKNKQCDSTRELEQDHKSERASDGHEHDSKSGCSTKFDYHLKIQTLRHMQSFKWDGSQPFRWWLQRFNDCAELEGWSDQEKARKVQYFLVGWMRNRWDTIPGKDRMSFCEVTVKLKEIYDTVIPTDEAKQLLSCCYQKKSESVKTFAGRLTSIVRVLTAKDEVGAFDRVAKEEFLQRLRPDLMLHVVMAAPKGFQEALDTALYLEVLLMGQRERAKCEDATNGSMKHEALCEAAADAPRAMTLEGAVRCYHCRGTGHMRSNCPRRQERRQRTRNRVARNSASRGSGISDWRRTSNELTIQVLRRVPTVHSSR